MTNPRPTHLNPAHGRAATPIAFIQAILLAYKRYGISPDAALAQAQISAAELADPTCRVTANQMELMSGHAMLELDDEALGWFSRPLPWGTYGMLCRASFTAPNLGVALKRWCRHHRLLTDDIALTLTTNARQAELTLTSHRDFGPSAELCLVSNLRCILGFACWAIDSRIPLNRVEFPFPKPAHSDVYPLLFEGPIEFRQDTTRACFDARYLNLSVRRDESALQTMLQRALPLTIRQYRRDRLLAQRVRNLLQDQVELSNTAENIAFQLHVSVRTLHRQLREEGASLQQIKDDIRREKAMELLNRSPLSIKQVAAKIGFHNEKSFVRAFKNWTGVPPGVFRGKQSGDKPA